MISIIQGQEEVFIRKKIEEMTASADAEIYRFDGSAKDFSAAEMLSACEGVSLFSARSIVLVSEPFFLMKKCDEKDEEDLSRYAQDPSKDCDLILYTYQNAFNSRLKLYQTFSKNAQVMTLNSYDNQNFTHYVRSRISEEHLEMTREAADLLDQMCKRSATLLERNIEVLKLYPERIDEIAVSKLCSASDDNDAFELVNAITDRDISRAIASERKLMSENDSALSVIGLLANQLRFLYHVAYLDSIGKKKNEIIEITGASDYRLKKAYNSLSKLSMKKITELLHRLSGLDVSCKTDNSIPDKMRFELFTIQLLKERDHVKS